MHTNSTCQSRSVAATALCSFLLLLTVHAHALTLTAGGKSRFAIVLPDDAITAEVTAGRELRDYLHQITGARLPIVRESKASWYSKRILVGPSAIVRELLPQQDWKALGSDGIIIRTLPDALILAGGRPRGSLYAVYTFLEDTVGVRWWTSSESTIPTSSTLSVPPLNITCTPKLRYREAFNYDALKNGRFAARLKVNGHFHEIPEQYGGHYTILGWCHTSYELMPPAKYFATHPEWYSLLDGKRNPERGQLCWTNEDMCAELARNALEQIRKNPTAGIISISQNDWHGQCQCEACRAVEKQEGSAAGPLVQGVNTVASEVEKEFPDFLIETLAYQYSRKPPRTIRPAKNVLIRLCSIEADFAHPLSADSNASFRDDLLAWKAIAPNLFIWNYVTSFADYLIPHPNMLPLGDDLRFFTENHVVGVFEQGDSFNRLAGDFLPLRTWLVAHLMWDPTREQAALRDEFLRGYYGAAAPYLGEYLDLVNAPANSPEFRMGCYNGDTSFLSRESIERATELFDKAERAVAANRDLSRRVRRERLALDHVRLLRYVFAPGPKGAKGKSRDICAEYDNLAQKFVTAARKMGVRHFSEAQAFDSYVPVLMARCQRNVPPDLPAAGDPVPKGCFDLQENQFRLANPGVWAKIVDDPGASNGKAARMPCDHTQWAVQLHIPANAKYAGPGPWRCYIVARCDARTTSGAAFGFGLHDSASNAYLACDTAPLERAAGKDYRAFGIFIDDLKPGQYFWVSPKGNPEAVEAIYVDRIYLQRVSALR